jgi:tetratricopeptide (TPR) repeat protein
VAPPSGAAVVEAAVALGESWSVSLRDRDEGAFAALDADAQLIDEAMETAIALDDREHALRLIGAVWFYWIVRGLQQRANTWCRQTVELSGSAAPLVEARGLVGASEIARACGEYRHSATLKEEALRLNEDLGDKLSVAALLADLAHLWVRLDDLRVAEAYATSAVELRRNDKLNRGGVAHALLALGEVKEHQGELAVATLHYEGAIDCAHELGLEGEAAFVRARLLGRVARKTGDYQQAFGTYRRALLDSLPLRDAGTVAMATQGLGWVAAERGDDAGAVRHYASVSGEHWQRALDPDERKQFAADLEWLRRSVEPALFEAAWSIGLQSPPFEIPVPDASSVR